ncbi:MAG TPA: heparan-alpha-glucosaminide N-acetyltransferase domain-containing protein [Polyangiaceae bacterium]|jgi:uncharacterized membrane protein
MPAASQSRIAPLDLLRGLVMVLMAVDHSSDAFNAGRLFTDSAFMYKPGDPLPLAQFLTRFITHLCAPTFLFLAGTGLAFTLERRLAQSWWAAARYVLTRGLLIASFELWISWFVMPKGVWLCQVLYAIGISYCLMIPFLRLSARAALALGLCLVAFGEALVGLSVYASGGPEHVPLALQLLLVGGRRPALIIAYPVLHWFGLLLLGFAWGKQLLASPAWLAAIKRHALLGAAGCLVVFGVVRSLNGYGNMLLPHFDNSLAQWLHVSKYPPSIAYVSLELALMGLALSLLCALCERGAPAKNQLLLVLGQTPLFFYLLHFPLLVGSAKLLDIEHHYGVGSAYLGAAIVIALLYPACRAYRTYKTAHPRALTRYV